MDTFDPYPRPVSDPAADGLPETAADDSFADDERDRAGSTPSTPRRTGRTGRWRWRTSVPPAPSASPVSRCGRRLRRERPDLTGRVGGDRRPARACTPTPSRADQSRDRGGLRRPRRRRPGRSAPGLPGVHVRPGCARDPVPGRGRAADRDRGRRSRDEVAFDAGVSGGGFSAEEGAMHEVPDEELTAQGGPGDPYVAERAAGSADPDRGRAAVGPGGPGRRRGARPHPGQRRTGPPRAGRARPGRHREDRPLDLGPDWHSCGRPSGAGSRHVGSGVWPMTRAASRVMLPAMCLVGAS